MDADFDTKLKNYKNAGAEKLATAKNVHETLEIAAMICNSVFHQYDWEAVVAVYKLLDARKEEDELAKLLSEQ